MNFDDVRQAAHDFAHKRLDDYPKLWLDATIDPHSDPYRARKLMREAGVVIDEERSEPQMLVFFAAYNEVAREHEKFALEQQEALQTVVTAAQFAADNDIPYQDFYQLCKFGQVPGAKASGAQQTGKTWLLTEAAGRAAWNAYLRRGEKPKRRGRRKSSQG